jgi:hypothetical protein
MSTTCEERHLLQRAYKAYRSDYQRAIDVLRERIGVMPARTYRDIREGAEEARRRSEEARALLEAHVAQHRCGEEPSSCCASAGE